MPKPFLLIGGGGGSSGGGGGSGGSSGGVGGVGLSAFRDRPVANRFDEEIKISYICERHCASPAYES
ncbi:hypothetical protein G5I_12579 [Acromyrmex echinatior]|uniref:Uncharacterized protein n=1 Tax=Acromyrmex echinatior TaxID=103372 RepID=F4X2P8_ACREC|nr:hypothetical protein G5I_12579 [Acromyrmex echinatior]